MSKWLDRTFPSINTLWRGEWKKGVLEPGRYLYDHELVFVSRGNVFVQIEGRKYELREGSYIIVPPNTLHLSKGLSSSVFRSCIHFDWYTPKKKIVRPIYAFYPKRPKRSLIIPPPPFLPGKILTGKFDLQGKIPSLLETLFFQWETGDSFQHARARGVLWEILVQLLWKSPKNRLTQDHSSQLAYTAKDILDQNHSLPQGVQSALSSAGFSYEHICRLFHKKFGLTPMEYLNAQRLENAKILLKNPKLTITEIAYAAGFKDAGYFTRKFRQRNGITPREYRQA